jgi:hypothetical protein
MFKLCQPAITAAGTPSQGVQVEQREEITQCDNPNCEADCGFAYYTDGEKYRCIKHRNVLFDRRLVHLCSITKVQKVIDSISQRLGNF